MKISNERFELELAKDFAIKLTDLKTNVIRESPTPFHLNYGNQYDYNLAEHCRSEVKQEADRLIINFDQMEFWSRFKENGYIKPDPGPDLHFEFSIILAADHVKFRIEALEGMDKEKYLISFPYGLTEFNSNEKANILVPCGYGNLIQFPRTDYINFKYETGIHYTCLPIQGVFTESGGLGLYIKTSFDAECKVNVNSVVKSRASLETSFVFEDQNANYARELHVYPLGKDCDYVDLAKLYRNIVKNEGRFVSLNEKIEQNQEVEKLVGAVIWKHNVYSKKRPDGVEKGYSLYIMKPEYNEYEGLPNNWTAKEIFDTAKDRGFDRVCVYNTGWNNQGFDSGYPTRLPPNPARGNIAEFKSAAEYARSLSADYIYSVHDNYIDCYENSSEYDPAIMTYDKTGTLVQGGIWRGGRASLMCTTQSMKYAKRDIPQLAKMLTRGSIYIDVIGCTYLQSCHHPNHPQGKRGDAKSRRELLSYIKGKMGSLTTEGTPTDYLADIVDLGAFCAIYLSPALTPITAPVPVPVPFWQLVYHDSVLNYTSEGAYGAYGSEYILHVALFGMLPTQFDETSKKLSFKLRETYTSEMLSHEFLEPTSVSINTDDSFHTDGVARTVFSDDTEVVANFRETQYNYHGQVIPARDFIIINGK